MPSQWHASRSGFRSSTNARRHQQASMVPADCRNFATTLCVLGCVVFTLLLLGGCGNKNVSAAAAPPPNVQIIEVIQRDVPMYHEYLATLDGFVNAQIQPQVSGYLIKQNYLEGAVVRQEPGTFQDRSPAFSSHRGSSQGAGRTSRGAAWKDRSWMCSATLRWPKKKQLRRANSTTTFKPISLPKRPSRPIKLHWNRPN